MRSAARLLLAAGAWASWMVHGAGSPAGALRTNGQQAAGAGDGPAAPPLLKTQPMLKTQQLDEEDKAQRERLIRDLEAVSSFRLDFGPLNKILENIANRTAF